MQEEVSIGTDGVGRGVLPRLEPTAILQEMRLQAKKKEIQRGGENRLGEIQRSINLQL